MNEPTTITTIAIAGAVLTWLWFGPLAALRRDDYRSDIRSIRDGLFDFMLEGGYSFESPAYREVRQTLNGMLRWSNVINGPKFLISFYYSAKYGDSNSGAPCLLDDCDDGLRAKIEEVRNAAVNRTLRFVFLEGMTGAAVMALLSVLSLFKLAQRVKRAVSSRSGVIASEAYSLGGRLTATELAWLTPSKLSTAWPNTRPQAQPE